MSAQEEVLRLQEVVKQQSSELEILNSLVHVMREDLNVKNEQFDLLYNSLKASQLHNVNANEHVIQELKERVFLLERLLEEKNKYLADQRHLLEEKNNGSRLLSTTTRDITRVFDKQYTVKNIAGLDDDVLYHILSYCTGEELGKLAMTTMFLRNMTYHEFLWKSLFNIEFSILISESKDKQLNDIMNQRSWKCRYQERYRTERNWNKGEAQRITLMGHRGTVTSLTMLSKGRHIISGSDDGSLIFWGLARRSLESSVETTPPPALALAQLAEHRRMGSMSVFTSNFERSLNAFGNMNITGSSNSNSNLNSQSSHSSQTLTNTSSSSSSSASSSNHSSFVLSHSSPDSASQSIHRKKLPHNNKSYNQNTSTNSSNLLNMFSSNNHNTKYGNSAGAELGSLPRPIDAIDDIESPLTHYGQFEKLRFYHGHGGPVWCLDVDEESGTLVSGSYDRTIKVWDLWSGACVRSLRDHTGWVSCVAIEKGGQKVISGSWDGTFKIWDAQAGTVRSSHHCGVGNTLYCLDMDRENGGNILTIGTRQRQVQIWDMETGQHLRSCDGHVKEVGAVKMYQNTICSGSADTSIKIWNISDAHCSMTLRGHEASVMCIDYDLSKHRVVSGGVDKTIRVWDLRKPDKPLVKTFENVHKGDVFTVKFDEDRIVSGSADGKVSVLNFNYRRQ